jgi:hypothetical protein
MCLAKMNALNILVEWKTSTCAFSSRQDTPVSLLYDEHESSLLHLKHCTSYLYSTMHDFFCHEVM